MEEATLRRTLLPATLSSLLAALLLAGAATPTAPPRTVTAHDGGVSLDLPEGWKSRPYLNSEAGIEVGDVRRQIYLIVISDPKERMGPLSMAEHSELSRGTILGRLERGRITGGPVELEIDGRAAVQYELRGRIDGLKVAYFHVTVDGADAFHQIVAWTRPSRLEENRETIESVIRSFRENEF